MKIKTYWKTFLLVKDISRYRSRARKKLKNNNEICENYYRVNDDSGDGRGHF